MTKTQIKNLKKGDFFKRAIKGAPSEKVYIKGDYDRSTKSYSATEYYDINHEIFIKSDKEVFIDFEF